MARRAAGKSSYLYMFLSLWILYCCQEETKLFIRVALKLTSLFERDKWIKMLNFGHIVFTILGIFWCPKHPKQCSLSQALTPRALALMVLTADNMP